MSNQIEYIKPDIEIFETVVEKGFASSHNGGHGGHGGHGGGHGGAHGGGNGGWGDDDDWQ